MSIKLDTAPHMSANDTIADADGIKLDGIIQGDMGLRLDDTGMAFYKEQLEIIKTKVIEAKNENLRSREFIPVDNEGDIATNTISYFVFTKVGYAKFISEMADDIPRVDIYGEKHSHTAKMLASSYGYNIFEIARARKAGFALEAKRAKASADANRAKIDYVAWHGSEEAGLDGLINHPSTSRYSVPNGTAGTPSWPTKTPTEVLDDMYGIVDAQAEITFDNKPVTAMLMSVSMYNHINETRIADNLETTILEQFQKSRKGVSVIEGLRVMNDAGENGGDLLIAYNLSDDTLVQRIPEEMWANAYVLKNKEYVTENTSKIGGVVVYYPQAVTQAEFV